jgi:hypothetical protein
MNPALTTLVTGFPNRTYNAPATLSRPLAGMQSIHDKRRIRRMALRTELGRTLEEWEANFAYMLEIENQIQSQQYFNTNRVFPQQRLDQMITRINFRQYLYRIVWCLGVDIYALRRGRGRGYVRRMFNRPRDITDGEIRRCRALFANELRGASGGTIATMLERFIQYHRRMKECQNAGVPIDGGNLHAIIRLLNNTLGVETDRPWERFNPALTFLNTLC